MKSIGIIKRLLSKSEISLEKYISEDKDQEYNFYDNNTNIRIAEHQIEQEKKGLTINRRQGALFLTIFGFLFVFFPKILLYWVETDTFWYTDIIFISYGVFSLISVTFLILFLWPKRIPLQELPSKFYKEVKDGYEAEGLKGYQANIGIQSTYLEYLESTLKAYIKNNQWKAMWHTRTIYSLVFSFVFYLISSCIVIINSEKNNNSPINIFYMSNTEEKNNAGNNKPKQEKKYDPSMHIKVEPKLIREGKDYKK